MEDSEWIALDAVGALPDVRPSAIRHKMKEILVSSTPVWLGTEYVDWDQE